MELTNRLQEVRKKKMANQAQEYQYQQALIYINNEENLNLTEFNDDFIRRIIEQGPFYPQHKSGYGLSVGTNRMKTCHQRNSTDVLNPGASVLFFCG